MTRSRAKSFSDRLLAWYAKHQRDLPWRHDSYDPYRVWIAETLLQQTQVKTVIPYYSKFLACYPNVRALARARRDAVLKILEGLGYYARARNLQRAAKEIITRFDGKIPSTVAELVTLPGVGRYTAGAIASIAFNRTAPILDGNVMRVLCRYFNVGGYPKRAGTQKVLWKLAEDLIPRRRARHFNQALMDLGATICTPRNPRCSMCPMRRGCTARRLGIQEKLPAREQKRGVPHHDVGTGIVWRGNRILIAKRRADGLLGGLWEFPGGNRKRGESMTACVKREIREELGVEIAVGCIFAVIDHAYSHFSITLHAFQCRYLRGTPRALGCATFRWVLPRALSRYAFPAANRKIIGLLATSLRS